MTTASAKGPVKRVQIEATIIRADGTIQKLGRVADSKWYWNFGPGRWLAARRTRRANESLHG